MAVNGIATLGCSSIAARTMVTIPDLFRCFLVRDPELNPLYEKTRPLSEAWLINECSFSPGMARKVRACDFAYFCAVAAPQVQDQERFRLIADWGNWVFPFDDMFDEGKLRTDVGGTADVLESLMANVEGREYQGTKMSLVQAHDDIFARFTQAATDDVKRRYVSAMKRFVNGIAKHVKDFASGEIPSIDEMVDTRRLSIGVEPVFHLIEFAEDLRIPEEVIQHPIIKTLEGIGADLVILANDILSYRKEESEDCPFNIIAACRMTGQSTQEAFDTVGDILEKLYVDWDRAYSQLPDFGEHGHHVQRYIAGIQGVVQGNISWSFRTRRYLLGEHGAQVGATRSIDVLVQPGYLQAYRQITR